MSPLNPCPRASTEPEPGLPGWLVLELSEEPLMQGRHGPGQVFSPSCRMLGLRC